MYAYKSFVELAWRILAVLSCCMSMALNIRLLLILEGVQFLEHGLVLDRRTFLRDSLNHCQGPQHDHRRVPLALMLVHRMVVALQLVEVLVAQPESPML